MKGKAYGIDLRERVIRDCGEGMPVTAVAEKYTVSRWWIYNLKKRIKRTGSMEAGKSGGRRPRAIQEPQKLLELVEQHPDATILELQALLKKIGIKIKPSTLWSNLKYIGLTVKKNSTRLRTTASRRSKKA